MKRIMKDVKEIYKNPLTDNGIYYVHDEDNLYKGYAMIIGPENTPYEDGYYFFEIEFPQNYPYSPPTVTFLTNSQNVRFHPNLYVCGKVCLSILNTWRGETWTACQSLSSVLLTLCSIFDADPLIHEPGFETRIHTEEYENYNLILEFKNVEIAVLEILENPGKILPAKIAENAYLREIVCDHFVKRKKDIVERIRRLKMKRGQAIELVSTTIYKQTYILNYFELITELERTDPTFAGHI